MDYSIMDMLFFNESRAAFEWVSELEGQLRATRSDQRNFVKIIGALCEQNRALRLRLGVLIRLLVEKGVLTSEEYAGRIAEAEAAVAQTTRVKPDDGGAEPQANGKGGWKKLPKAPAGLGGAQKASAAEGRDSAKKERPAS